MEQRLLQVGDVVYSRNNHQWLNKYTIDRVTRTLAFAGDQGFKRVVDRDVVKPSVKPDRWSFTAYRLETPAIKAEFAEARKRMLALNKLNNADSLFRKATTEQLEAIIKILNL